MSTSEPVALYKSGTPLRANSKQHKEDLRTIRAATRKMETAERLVRKRRDDRFVARVDAMLFELHGRRKRYPYDQTAALQLAYLVDQPLDPITQVPLWRELVALTKHSRVDRATFLKFARNILCQHSLYDKKWVSD
ncbi:hypothetical protein [Tropicimonas sp. S265A]|uniref:hypothetical protein n=1 Tax=Tropicimonas sp. S265A TaxID=3415134 RepID=UPI003C7B8581